MLFTRKGDNGETGVFGCDQRFSKSSAIAEALGSLDEINSLLGLCKLESLVVDMQIAGRPISDILSHVQQALFIVQAEVAGAEKLISPDKVAEMESIIEMVEKFLPPIKSFFVAGGTAAAARLDYARAVARRAERRVVAVATERQIGAPTLAYLNRLSSLLYALARFVNHQSGIEEQKPTYQ